LDKLITEPERPFVLVMGGAKVLDKMMVLKNLIKKVDYILLGGVMANTFMTTRGVDVKKSLIERDRLELADKLFRRAPKKFIFPTTLIWNMGKIVDVDPSTIDSWKRYFDKAKTIFWNGTMGLTSMSVHNFSQGTREMAKLITESKATKIVAGGDTIAEVAKLKLENKFDFVSTGGGATLEYLAGEKLPGLEVLK
jgi:phosphoglycerate kinase